MPKLRLNSFPVIAIAALLVAGLLGFGLGSLGGGMTVVPATPIGPDDPEGGGGAGPGLAGLDRDRRATPRDRDRQGDTGDNKSRENGRNGTGTTSTPGGNGDGNGRRVPHDPGKPRELKEGRTDPVVEGVRPDEPGSVIRVTVSDTRGNRLPFGLLALDVKSGPLGWHAVPSQPQAVAGERGVFEFKGLYPGDYRVRSIATNYQEIEEEVRISRNGETQNVSVTLEQMGAGQVEFYLSLEDGSIPEEVETRIKKGDADETATKGRFGEYEAPPATRPRGGVLAPTRYRQRTDGSGMVKLTLSTGVKTTVTFTARTEAGFFRGVTEIVTQPGLQREDLTLMPVELEGDDPYVRESINLTKLVLTLTLDGEDVEFTRVNLRKDITDFQYRNADSSEGNTYTWDNIFSGAWFLVAESTKYHAPFVKELTLGEQEQQSIDVRTGHLRVVANRESGSPDPSGEMRYRVRLRPMGSGTVERAYNGNMTGKDRDHIDFFVPEGEFAVRVESPENYARLSVTPVEQELTMTPDGKVTLDYTVAAAATLRFTAVNKTGQPIPNAEYLVSFNPAGELPDNEQGNVRKGGYDGVCEATDAPSGPVYVHIWTESTDWQNPDHVFQLDLPAYGTEDLGAIIVGN